MGSDNVERFHEILRQWMERRRLEPEVLTRDVEWVNPPDSVEGGTRRGVKAFNEAIASVFEGWEESRFEPERVIARGEEIVALGELRAHGRAVPHEVRQEHGQIWTFRDGRLARMRWFNSHREALEAAGPPT
jgi:ketosteroid isomerase-like protein